MEDYKMFDYLKSVEVEGIVTIFYFEVETSINQFLEDEQIQSIVSDRSHYVTPTGTGFQLKLMKKGSWHFEMAE